MDAFSIGLPPRLSAVSIEALEATLAAAATSDAKVWQLEGTEPGVFCRGMDLSSVASASDGREAVLAFARCMRLLMGAPRPTLAIIEGEALGGGAGIAAACDLTVATTEATIGLPETLFGILPAMIMPALLSRMTPQRARLLALTCASQSAEWAQAAGLFDRVVAPDRLDKMKRRARKDLSRVAPSATGRLRDLVHRQSALPWGEGLDEATEIAAATVADPDIQRAVARFLEEGVAPWTA